MMGVNCVSIRRIPIQLWADFATGRLVATGKFCGIIWSKAALAPPKHLKAALAPSPTSVRATELGLAKSAGVHAVDVACGRYENSGSAPRRWIQDL